MLLIHGLSGWPRDLTFRVLKSLSCDFAPLSMDLGIGETIPDMGVEVPAFGFGAQ